MTLMSPGLVQFGLGFYEFITENLRYKLRTRVLKRWEFMLQGCTSCIMGIVGFRGYKSNKKSHMV